MISEVVHRYARALFEVAKSSGREEIIFKILKNIADAIEEKNNEISDFLESPIISSEIKLKVIETSIEKLNSGNLQSKIPDELVYFLRLLAVKNRLSILGKIYYSYESINDQSLGVMRGVVKAASPVSQDEISLIQATVGKLVSRKVLLTFVKDMSIMGGMVAQVGGWTFDDSLQSHLTLLNEKLNRRAN